MNLNVEQGALVGSRPEKTYNEWLADFWETETVTPKLLLNLAQSLAYRAGLIVERCPVTEVDRERDAMLKVAHQAAHFGAWMMSVGLESAERLGPFGSRRPVDGEKVKVRIGAVVSSAAASVGGMKQIDRPKTVTVEAVTSWYVDWDKLYRGDRDAFRESEVAWLEKGVLHWTGISNIEPNGTARRHEVPALMHWRMH